MKAAVLQEVGKLVYQDVENPRLSTGEVLLRVRACGICSSDIPRVFVTGTYHFPTIPGHEFAGEIVDVAADVDRALIGRRAAVFPLRPCMECPSCRAGQYARCDCYNYYGSRCDGAFAEYIAVSVWNLVLFSDSIDYARAAMCEPAAVALHCVQSGGIAAGMSVAVLGTGTIGIMAAMWAKLKGAAKIIIPCRNREKFDFIRGLDESFTVVGGTQKDYEEELKGLSGSSVPDVVLECVGSQQAVTSAIEIAGKGATIVLTGNPDGDFHFGKPCYWKILRKELQIRGIWNSVYPQDWNRVIAAMENGTFQPEKLITHRFALKQCGEAFDVLRDRNTFFVKVMLEMQPDSIQN